MTPRQRYALEHPVEVLAGAQAGEEYRWAVAAGKTSAVSFMLTVDLLLGRAVWHASASLHHVVAGPIPAHRLSSDAVHELSEQLRRILAGVGDRETDVTFAGDIAWHLKRDLTSAEEAELRRAEVAS